jgi:hypothetical protein
MRRCLVQVVCTVLLAVVGLGVLVELRALNEHLENLQRHLNRATAAQERTEQAVREALKRFGLGIE